jgi:hypothetical protein
MSDYLRINEWALIMHADDNDLARMLACRNRATSEKHFDKMLDMQIEWKRQCNRGLVMAPKFEAIA